MLEQIYRLRILLVSVALVAFAGVTMLADQRSRSARSAEDRWWSGATLEIAVPLQRVLEIPFEWVRSGVDHFASLSELRDTNDQLRRRIAELEEENLQYREALVSSGRLQRIVELRDRFETPMRPAEVVGQDVSPWFRSVLLDRGRSHDVRSGMPVVTDRGVVGLVTATAPHAARAMLLLDRQSAVDAIVQRSRARGIVRGTGSGRLEFVFVVRGDDIRAGDAVITSGVGGVYPKGLRIGKVTGVEVGEDLLLHTAALEPSVNFGRLEQVFVMLRRGAIMELLHEDEASETRAGSGGEG